MITGTSFCSWGQIVAVMFDTMSSSPHRRLAVWQDIVCDTFVDLDCQSAMREDFRGTISRSNLGSATCARVSSCAQHVTRTSSRIARSREDYVLLALVTTGINEVDQDGRQAVVSAGQFVMYDTTRPYQLRFDDSFSQTVFQFPRKLLHQRVGAFDGLTATNFAGERPIERLAYEFLLGLSRTIDDIGPMDGTRLMDKRLTSSRWLSPIGCNVNHPTSRFTGLRRFIG